MITVEKSDKKRIQEAIEWDSAFVLVTNLLDRDEYSDADALREYKGQYVVENCFRFMKNPAFVRALYMKTPERWKHWDT